MPKTISLRRLKPSGRRLAKKEKKQVKTMINSAIQNDINITYQADYSETIALGTAGGTVVDVLNGMAVGDGEGTRTGNTIMVKHIDLRYFISGEASGDAQLEPNPKVRVIIGIDRDPRGTAVVSASTLFTAITSNHTILDQVPAWNYRKRFRILHDKVHTIRSQGIETLATPDYVQGETEVIKFKHTFKKPLVVTYDAATSATIPVTNSIFMLICAQISAMEIGWAGRTQYYE